jgi:hypothetical protein
VVTRHLVHQPFGRQDTFLEMRARVLDEIFDVEIHQISGALARMYETLARPESQRESPAGTR